MPAVLESPAFDRSVVRRLKATLADGAAAPGRALAEAAAVEVLQTYWRLKQADEEARWPLPPPPAPRETPALHRDDLIALRQLAATAAQLSDADASYLLSGVYTMLLPPAYRARHGVFYTPPALAERLLDQAEAAGVDWAEAQILDPACGGGAFLVPLVRRIRAARPGASSRELLEHIEVRLCGFEIDPFAAWVSRILLEASALDLCHAAGRRLTPHVETCDSLTQLDRSGSFDLVVANPPYGKIKLPKAQRRTFAESLFGHANLYGLFYDLALRLARPGGIIAYLTPTSFLAGEYFKRLRSLLARHAVTVRLDFVETRAGVFEDVLQEAVLAVHRLRPTEAKETVVHLLRLEGPASMQAEPAGTFSAPSDPASPWILPRTSKNKRLAERLTSLPARLHDYGYIINTGPLVWNRHKHQLRQTGEADHVYPLIWAEAVGADGAFMHRAEKKNHTPFFHLEPRQEHLLTRSPCVLLQRTTSKEQHRRLIAAELPAAFVRKHGAVVVENHLNILRPSGGLLGTPVSVPTLAALLRSTVVDEAFRCISGSVAVSAYELAALPLPAPENLTLVQRALEADIPFSDVDALITQLYLGDRA